ncbi:MAG: hypothetical protein EOO46_13705 [Flavobacterium sp.]|nr:MAG: hypothetical protein EOO46_13705 [Flavobacterium sp.]
MLPIPPLHKYLIVVCHLCKDPKNCIIVKKAMTRLLLFILLLLGQVAFAQYKDTSLGKPIFWYRVNDPWAMFIGAEGPVFILYDSGKILFWKNGAYQLAQADDQELSELKSDLHLHDTLFFQSRFINAVDPENGIVCCDHPTYTISYRIDTVNNITVLGSIRNSKYRKHIPDQFLAVHDFVSNFDDDKAIFWAPEKVEVLLSDYSHSPDSPIKWPSDWPDLSSPDTRKQGGGYATSIYLDKKYLKQLNKLLKQRREKQAFEINGRKYFVGYRFPIPGLW